MDNMQARLKQTNEANKPPPPPPPQSPPQGGSGNDWMQWAVPLAVGLASAFG